MRIAIIGAGFTGLAAAFYLTLHGHKVTIFENDSKPGGLANGFKDKSWNWELEKHYHHIFTNDKTFIKIAKQIKHPLIIKPVKTAIFIKDSIQLFDSATHLLKFPFLKKSSKVRTGLSLLFLKYIPIQTHLEKIPAEKFLKKTMGIPAWDVLWKPLFEKKFSVHSSDINVLWFWTRIQKRTTKLGYPEGGFAKFATELAKNIKKNKGKFYFNTPINKIYLLGKEIKLTTDKKTFSFEKVICTLPTTLFMKLTPQLPKEYINRYASTGGIGAVNLVLELKEKFLPKDIYWLNINEKGFPFLAIVEHTNFISSKKYNNSHIVYIGNYVPSTDPKFNMNEDQLLKLFQPYLKKINSKFSKKMVKNKWVHKAAFAQPIYSTNYSKTIPSFTTPLEGVYLSNIQQVYPYDRGTNYALEFGEKVSKKIIHDERKR